MTTPSSSLALEGHALPQPVAQHGASTALGRPLAQPERGDVEPDTRTALCHDQPTTRPVLNDLADSLASTTLTDSSPPLPPLPPASSSYPLLPDIPGSSSARASSSAPPHADAEVEALVDPPEQAARSGARKSSLTPSEEALILPGVQPSATSTARRRPSVDAQSVASGTSGRSAQSGGHSFATAKNYFPLVQKRSAAGPSTTSSAATTTASAATADPWGAPASPGAARASPAGSPASETPPPMRQARRRPSGSSSLASSTRPASVFPTIKPSRSAGSSVFPLRSPPSSSSTTAAAPAADSPSARSSDAGSLRSDSLVGAPASPPPSLLARPTPSPAHSGTSPSLFSRPSSSVYTPSLAPSRRSTETSSTSLGRGVALAKPSYAKSRAPSHAEAFYASAPEPLPGPPSIFLNPTPQPRSVKELLPNPKRRLSAFFGGGGGGGSSGKARAPGDAAAAASSSSGRAKSASILDAALASSATWAAHRGEQWRAPAHSAAAFPSGASASGPPVGYRPAHQVRRQQEEAAARLAAARATEAAGAGAGAGEGAASPGGPTMGGGGEVPVSGEAIAEAFTRNQGREALGPDGARAGEGAGGRGGAGLERTRSGVSMASVAGIDEPAGRAFPVRREAFPTRARPQGGAAGAE